ncbi:MAG: bestrophin family protein [Flavobacteriales bacterium]
MYINRNIHWLIIWSFGWRRVLIFICIAAIAVSVFKYMGCLWLQIPFLPVSLVGTATAFYIGFKNNASYDRLWEARRLWGSIVNDSRTWALCSRDYVTNLFASDTLTKDALHSIHTRLVHRHIAYVNALRMQLRKPQPWEHNNSWNNEFSDLITPRYGMEELDADLKKTLSDEERQRVLKHANMALAILSEQSSDIELLRSQGLLDDFRHVEMQKLVQSFINNQGGCERIKNFPFPRQYAFFSNVFVWVFVILLPFSLLESFSAVAENFVWLVIPFSALISWLLMTMELVGDYSENPFENLINDVPINSMSRNIEIEMRTLLGETQLPERIQPIQGILM